MDDQVKCWCCGGELMDYPGEPWEPICDDCWARSTYLKPEKADDSRRSP